MNLIPEQSMKMIRDKILESKTFILSSHVQPDGDNIGSSLALYDALKKMNKEVLLLKNDDIPRDFLFLPGANEYVDLDLDSNKDFDVFISLDCGDQDRLGKNKAFLPRAKTIINIDHHISNTYFGDLNYIDVSASSTGEIVYDFIKVLGLDLDSDMGICIYTAISTDTGSFLYDNTSSKAHRIAGELIDLGIDKKAISVNVYQNKSLEKTNLFIKALGSLEFYGDNRIGLVGVTQELLKETNTKMEDTEGIVAFIRDIEPVEVAVLLKEIDDKLVKVSLRSKNYLNVSDICANFGGGGHIRAAGCSIKENFNLAKKEILEKLLESLGD